MTSLLAFWAIKLNTKFSVLASNTVSQFPLIDCPGVGLVAPRYVPLFQDISEFEQGQSRGAW